MKSLGTKDFGRWPELWTGLGRPSVGVGPDFAEGEMSNAFTTSKKGELFELKAELNSESKSTRKEAVRKTISAMTAGRDVSSLFTDVLNCMQTNNIEIKKLVYLYVVNYAQTKPVSRDNAVGWIICSRQHRARQSHLSLIGGCSHGRSLIPAPVPVIDAGSCHIGG